MLYPIGIDGNTVRLVEQQPLPPRPILGFGIFVGNGSVVHLIVAENHDGGETDRNA